MSPQRTLSAWLLCAALSCAATATAARPAYQATDGYGGAQFIVSASKRFDQYWVGGFARYDSLYGATFADSPLVRSSHYWSAGVGIAWMIGKSAQTVDAAQ